MPPALPESLFAWAHLSDLHIGHGGAADGARRHLILEALARDLGGAVDRGCPRLDAIFVTGDVAWSGAEVEYAEARTCLAEIAQAAGIGLERVFVVPGEHDVDRPAGVDTGTTRLLRALRRGEEKLDAALEVDADRAALRQRLAPYLAFAAELAPGCADLFSAPSLPARDGLRLRVVCLNTALLATGEADHGKLQLGGAQLARALRGEGEGELIVVLSHHPFRGGWLADEREADGWIANHAHLHLFGHGSYVRSEDARSGGGGQFVRISAGDRGYGVAAIVRRAEGGLAVRLWPRRWSEEQKDFVDDVDNMGRGGGLAEHVLRWEESEGEIQRKGAKAQRRKKAERVFEGAGGVPIAPVPHFMGRDEEMLALKAALAQDKAVCVVATGLGGIGKTSLVRQLVAEHGPEMFPDGTVWIDAMTLDVDVARVCRRFGYDGEREPTVREGASFLATALHDERVLVVIDNVWPDRIDVTALPVVGGKARTVITSRAITLHESLDKPARAITLGRWGDEACRSYLRDVVPSLVSASDRDLDALASFVGGLPLAVRLLARLLLRPGSTPVRLLARLEREPLGTLDKFASEAGRGVVQTFNASYEGLDENQRRVLLALAACARVTSADIVAGVVGPTTPMDEDGPKSTEIPWIAGVAGMGEAEVGEALADLAERSLVDCVDRERGLWTLHDVVRLFVRGQEGIWQADERHLALAERHVEAHQDPLDWQAMDAGMGEVLAAVDRLLSAGEARRGWQIFARACAHLMQRGRYGEAVERCAQITSRLPDESEGLADALRMLGAGHRTLGDIPKAIGHFQRSLAIEQKLGRLGGQAANLGNLGDCYRGQGDIQQAIEHFELSLAIEKELGRLEGQATDLGNLGLCYLQQDDVQKAIGLIERALTIDEQLGRIAGQARHLSNLGACYHKQEDIPKVVECLQRALPVFEKLGQTAEQAVQLHNLGLCHEAMTDISSARDCFQRSLALSRSIRLPDEHPYVRATLDALARLITPA